MGETATSDLGDLVDRARTWFGANAERREEVRERTYGEGSDDVAVFRTLSHAEEEAQIRAILEWQGRKVVAGFGAVCWPSEYGGQGLTRRHEEAVRKVERDFVVPGMHEAVGISMNIEAPTILTLGTEEQKLRWLPGLLRGESLCCQLFSEPGAGSDLGSLSCRAERDGDVWVVNGQKVWTTGAQFADLGYLIARTDPTAPRQTGCTAFVVDMATPGIEVRPLRQMSGGTSFNEVFFDDVRIPDADRISEVGSGWAAAMTTLAFERVAGGSGGGGGGGGPLELLALVARHLGRDQDPLVRQALAGAWSLAKVRTWTNRRAAAGMREGGTPGPEGSIGKLAFTNELQAISAAAALVVGPRLLADSGEWGTFAWVDQITGTPGMRIAGGTDEIQRNTIGERVLGLPREPRPQ